MATLHGRRGNEHAQRQRSMRGSVGATPQGNQSAIVHLRHKRGDSMRIASAACMVGYFGIGFRMFFYIPDQAGARACVASAAMGTRGASAAARCSSAARGSGF